MTFHTDITVKKCVKRFAEPLESKNCLNWTLWACNKIFHVLETLSLNGKSQVLQNLSLGGKTNCKSTENFTLLSSLSLSEKISCTGILRCASDFKFEQKIPCIRDFEFCNLPGLGPGWVRSQSLQPWTRNNNSKHIRNCCNENDTEHFVYRKRSEIEPHVLQRAASPANKTEFEQELLQLLLQM